MISFVTFHSFCRSNLSQTKRVTSRFSSSLSSVASESQFSSSPKTQSTHTRNFWTESKTDSTSRSTQLWKPRFYLKITSSFCSPSFSSSLEFSRASSTVFTELVWVSPTRWGSKTKSCSFPISRHRLFYIIFFRPKGKKNIQ